jgi:hypothetical protein
MSRKRAASESADTQLRRIERAKQGLFMQGLYENLYAARKCEGKRSVRLVVDKASKLVTPISTDAEALAEATDLLGSGEFAVEPVSLRALSDDEVVGLLQPGERQAVKRLKGGR